MTSSQLSAPPRSRFSGWATLLAFAALVLVAIVVGVMGYRSSTTSEVQGTKAPPPWPSRAQAIVDSFPKLLPAGDDLLAPGWRKATCVETSGEGSHGINCLGHESANFQVDDYGAPEAVRRKLDSVASETYTGGTAKSATQPHSGCPTAPLVFISPAGSPASGVAQVYTTFPDDPARSRYLIGIQWFGHSPDEIIADWWTNAPLCG